MSTVLILGGGNTCVNWSLQYDLILTVVKVGSECNRSEGAVKPQWKGDFLSLRLKEGAFPGGRVVIGI